MIRRRHRLGSPVSESPRNEAAIRAQEFWQREATHPQGLATFERLGMTFLEANVVAMRVQLKIKEYEGKLMLRIKQARVNRLTMTKLRDQLNEKRAHIRRLEAELDRRDELDGLTPEVAVSLAHQTL